MKVYFWIAGFIRVVTLQCFDHFVVVVSKVTSTVHAFIVVSISDTLNKMP